MEICFRNKYEFVFAAILSHSVVKTWKFPHVSSKTRRYSVQPPIPRTNFTTTTCLLRAVAFHLTGRYNLEKQTANLFRRYLERCQVDVNDFKR